MPFTYIKDSLCLNRSLPMGNVLIAPSRLSAAQPAALLLFILKTTLKNSVRFSRRKGLFQREGPWPARANDEARTQVAVRDDRFLRVWGTGGGEASTFKSSLLP